MMGSHRDTFVLPFTGSVGWMSHAACAGYDTEMFFCDPQTERDVLADALSLCHVCPVMKECLDYALKNELDGIWGGTKDAERRQMLNKRRRR